MKAIKCPKYGPPGVLKVVNIEKPKPKDNEILVKNYYTTVTVADCRIRGFKVPASFWLPARLFLGLFRPKQSILGNELSGIIEDVGKNIEKFHSGDEIFAFTSKKMGAYAEYVCLDENMCIALKPKNLSFEQSAALSFGGITALFFLDKCKVKKGEKILIYGASGSVGTSLVQIAKYFGANVTGICSSENMEMVKNIGADSVYDYKKTDLSDINEKYDIFIDAVGKGNVKKSINVIKQNYRYIHIVADPFTLMKINSKSSGKNIEIIGGTYIANVEQINRIKIFADEGFFKPVIDKIFNFSEIVSAHEYVDKGHKKGNVIIKIIE